MVLQPYNDYDFGEYGLFQSLRGPELLDHSKLL